MQGTYIAREARMQQYLEKARDLIRQFQSWKIVQIPKEENVEADTLANLASAAEATNEENASVIHLFHSALDQDKNEVNFNNLTWDWRNEIINFCSTEFYPKIRKRLRHFDEKLSAIVWIEAIYIERCSVVL